MQNFYRKFLIIISGIFLPMLGFAQLDSLTYQVDMWGGAANQPYMPHWLVANRFGVLDYDHNRAGLLKAGLTSHFRVNKHFTIEAGLEGIARTTFSNTDNNLFLQQGYVKAKYGIFELSGGRIERTLGNHAEHISSGSMAISGNARPIPQIMISVPEYAKVPFTNGYVEFKGTFTHGWFAQDRRYIRNALLHEKSFYLKAGGKSKINVSAGIIHLVTWGGKLPNGKKLPMGFDNYVNVILAQSAVNIDSTDSFQIGEAANAVGDNLGVYDFAVHIKLKEYDINIYHQTPFEDWTGSRLARNKDRLLGINLSSKRKDHWFESIVYEFIYTKYQSGPTLPGGPDDIPGAKDKYGNDFGGRDNYYNNYLYKTGWAYNDHIIGTPLFYTKSRMKLYDPTFIDPDEKGFNFNIVNNRVVAHHFGIIGHYQNKWKYKVMATFSRNLGTYGGINGGITHWGSIENPDAPYAFKPAKNQNYFLTSIERRLFPHLTLHIAAGIDTGEIYNSTGLLAGLRWDFNRAREQVSQE
uniref:Capsule assembly Wzi family protein n=1 Tax=Roseihalotalea indica TaxID=2867963 RepID=A0AA49PZI2_9BACT|nr:capsule assembly Wzi family protein [Tunicatimonas sp. TK19036]